MIPNSTYRIQFNKEFTFEAAGKIINYLAALGINTLYASPVFKAKKGSMHGYDVVDHNCINPEIGDDDSFYNLLDKVKASGMNWLQDIVPNHMSYSTENKLLMDVFENGPYSKYYKYFDIEWDHPHASARERILAPFLGKFYQESLESGELKLCYGRKGFYIAYYESHYPIKLESYPDILSTKIRQLRKQLGKNHPDFIKLLGIIFVLKSIANEENIEDRNDQIKFSKRMFWELFSENEEIKNAIDEAVNEYNGEAGNPESFNKLDSLLGDQYFRLAYWKVANEEVNYRRFFNINELISLKMENEETFKRHHQFVLKLFKENLITGLRIDHVDGLFDPTIYLKRLKEAASGAYILVEKIVDLDEPFPQEWRVNGTTGYEFANYVAGIFCRKDNRVAMNDIYERFIGEDFKYHELVFEKKKQVIKTMMAGDVERLAFLVEKISSKDRYGVDFTMFGLKQALDEILTYFPIYRTYINNEYQTDRDKEIIDKTLEKAHRSDSRYNKEYDYIGRLLKLELNEAVNPEVRETALNLVMKVQQLTGPLMAKGLEDTTLYIFNRLISLNEVGGNPGKFGIRVKEFHNFNYNRNKVLPSTMNSTSTHDTKRGEDVRARINVLSEFPQEWGEKVRTWNNINRKFKAKGQRQNIPSRNDEYFLYQTLIGSFPFEGSSESYIKRIQEYVIKAAKEAKVFTTWIKPDEQYEKALLNFVQQILNPVENNEFLKDLSEFQKKINFYGLYNSLSQVILKIMSPGVPDFYQGTELWDFSLVDPDNRRPVDYSLRAGMLDEIKNETSTERRSYYQELLKNYVSGKIKLLIIFKLLQLRKRGSSFFNKSNYIPVNIEGAYTKNIIAFSRRYKTNSIIVIVPRFLKDIVEVDDIPIGDKWKDTSLKLGLIEGTYTNVFTKEELNLKDKLFLKDVFASFPFAVLKSKRTVIL